LLTDSIEFDCPWCGEPNWIEVEPEEAGQTVVQDCAVCCAPITIRLPDQPGHAIAIERE